MHFDVEPRPRRKLLPLQLSAPDIEAWLLARDPMAIGAWDSIGREEYARAFTAAETAGADVVDDLYFGIVDIIAGGGTEDDYAKLVVPILKRKGWLGGDEGEIASRVRLIFDTQLNQARRAGRWDMVQAGKSAAPYLLAFTAEDERVRHPPGSTADHRAWEGICLPADHPHWQTYGCGHFDFRCRCDVLALTRSQFARRKGGVTSEDELAERVARIGPPRFAGPGAGITQQLADMTAANDAKPSIPGAVPISPVVTRRQGEDAWDAVLRANSLDDVRRNLAVMGF